MWREVIWCVGGGGLRTLQKPSLESLMHRAERISVWEWSDIPLIWTLVCSLQWFDSESTWLNQTCHEAFFFFWLVNASCWTDLKDSTVTEKAEKFRRFWQTKRENKHTVRIVELSNHLFSADSVYSVLYMYLAFFPSPYFWLMRMYLILRPTDNIFCFLTFLCGVKTNQTANESEVSTLLWFGVIFLKTHWIW